MPEEKDVGHATKYKVLYVRAVGTGGTWWHSPPYFGRNRSKDFLDQMAFYYYSPIPHQLFRLSHGPNTSVVQLHVAIKQGVREMWSMTLKIALMLVVVWRANLSLLLVTFLSRHTIDDTKKELLLSEETFSAFEKGLFSSFLY